MKKRNHFLILILFIIISLSLVIPLYLNGVIPKPTNFTEIALWSAFGIFWLRMINEGTVWVNNGKRSEWYELIAFTCVGIEVYILIYT